VDQVGQPVVIDVSLDSAAPPHAELVFAGKSVSHHLMSFSIYQRGEK